MSFWTAENFRKITQGQWLRQPVDGAVPLRGLSTDTRAIRAGQCFLALKGEKFDAHDYLPQAADAGAALLIIDNADKAKTLIDMLANRSGGTDVGVLLVKDALIALQTLATHYRDALKNAGCKVIAVAGSNGKTTTRNLIHTALSASFKGTQSPKSFNNHIGVPLTILSASLTEHQFVVVEVGTNHPGELAELAKIVRPDACVITSIGHEHMEFFKTLAGVAQEEKSILPSTVRDGLIVLDGDEPLLSDVVSHGPAVLRFGVTHACDLRVSQIHETAHGVNFTLSHRENEHRISQVDFTLPLLGRHNAMNAAAAIAVARWMGVDDQALARALAQAQAVDMRLNLLHLGSADTGIVLINDAYNANPSSMQAALLTLTAFRDDKHPVKRRVAILGDMRELGEGGPDLHRLIGRTIADLKDPAQIDLAIFIGRLAMFMAEPLSKSWASDRIHTFIAWDETVPQKVASLLKPGDLVLLKASRGVGLERLLPAIQTRFSTSQSSPS